MSAETLVIIIGAVFLLIAISGSLFSTGVLPFKVRILLALAGVLLIIFGGNWYGLINPQAPIEQVTVGNAVDITYPVDKVQLISPIAGDSVKCRILTMGVCPDSHDQDIWVLLKPSDGKYYPQSDNTNTSYKRNGEWQVITRFGGDEGELFDIIVFETDSLASEFFSSTVQNWKDALTYPGLDLGELPEGANEVDSIRISLKDNCRGVF